MRGQNSFAQQDDSSTVKQPNGGDTVAFQNSESSRKDSAVRQGFSPVFWRFYDRQESLEGLIAYSLYKRHKWEYVVQHGLNRNDDRLDGYDIGDSMVGMFRERAQGLLIKAKEDRSLAESIRKRSGFLASIPHNFAMSMVIPLMWCGLLFSGSMLFPDARSNLGAIAVKASIWLTDDARVVASAISQGIRDQDEFANDLSMVLEELIEACDPSKVKLIASLTEAAQNQAKLAQAIVSGDVFQLEPAKPGQMVDCNS